MASVAAQLRGVGQLFRVKPVLSWGASAFVLGVAVAVYGPGLGPNAALHGLLAFGLVALAQGFASHGFNDAYDWVTGTDKESIGKGTGGSRVIPEGKMDVLDTVIVALVALVGVLAIGSYFVMQYGTPMVVLLALAVYAPTAYSLPPLKLGYRPFAELTVVLPALTGVVAGTVLVLSGTIPLLAIAVGVIHALFCISWFIVSRIPDYEPDKHAGKRTTVVAYGLEAAKGFAFRYALAGGFASAIAAWYVSPAFLLGVGASVMHAARVSDLNPRDPAMASHVRLRNMHTTTVHAILLSLGLVALGVA